MEKDMQVFTQKEVAEATGINYNTIAMYANKGIIVPMQDNPQGKGTTRLYTKENLVQILLLRELLKSGVTLQNIKNHFQTIRQSEYFKRRKNFEDHYERNKLKDVPPDEKEILIKVFGEGSKFDEELPIIATVFDIKLLKEETIYYVLYDSNKDITYSYFSPDFPKSMKPKHKRFSEGEKYTSMLVIDMSGLVERLNL